MKHCKNGSSLLLALFCTTFLVIMCANFWKVATLVHALSHAKQLHEQRFRATEGILTWGIAVAKHKFESDKRIFRGWPVGDFRSYDGLLELSKNNNEMTLYAQLILDKEVVCSLSCILCKHIQAEDECENTYFTIKEWNRG